MFFCRFPMPEPSGTLANTVQNSILVNTGHAPIEIRATSELQRVSEHKWETQRQRKTSCSAAEARAG